MRKPLEIVLRGNAGLSCDLLDSAGDNKAKVYLNDPGTRVVNLDRLKQASAMAHHEALAEFVRDLANMTAYEWEESESWSDDQAEDALVCMNKLMEKARDLHNSISLHTLTACWGSGRRPRLGSNNKWEPLP